MTRERPTILCLSSEFKGERFIQTCKQLGCSVLLITREKFKDRPWPHESLDGFFDMPSIIRQPDITYAVSYLARSHAIDRIVALDDYDIETVAALREHLRLPGMGESASRFYRDKLAMRMSARENGIPVPDFTPVFNYQQLSEFMQQVPPPWVLKPRLEAGSQGIRKIHHADEVWSLLEQLGDEQSFFHLEQFLPGALRIFHVDSIVWQDQIRFAIASSYGHPPMSVAQEGGIFSTRTLPPDDPIQPRLLEMNQRVLQAMGLQNGITHAEFILSGETLYFLEVAARVGGAHIAEMLEAATGFNLWEERARMEVALTRGEDYQPPAPRGDFAGAIICLARQEWPDTAAYDDAEIVWRLNKAYHAGLILRSGDPGRIADLIESYLGRFAEDFLTSVPLPEKGRT